MQISQKWTRNCQCWTIRTPFWLFCFGGTNWEMQRGFICLFLVILPSHKHTKKPSKSLNLNGLSILCRLLSWALSGEGGIRTPGSSHFNGFQDRRDRPLCHLSLVLSQKLRKDRIIFLNKKTKDN